MIKRGNLQRELSIIGEEAGEGTEIQTVTLFKLMKAFEKVALRLRERNFKPVHTVVQYNYTMEGVREHMLYISKKHKTLAFEKIFDECENRIHAIFIFLNMLELVQQKFLHILIGEGRNNFIIEYNEDRTEDQSTELTAEDFSHLN
jgi:segregation and condensation protein A